jgi:ribose 5-phosphate isomerase B
VRIAIGSDHHGPDLKKFIIGLLTQAGHEYQDFGCYTTAPVDYPDIAREVGQAVAAGKFERGILICGTGIGMSIAANKVRGIRAALCCDVASARLTRQHNDANILCLKGKEEPELVAEIVDAFLTSEFQGGRHRRRVNKIMDMEN